MSDSEKQQQPETCTVINDKSQGSVATSFRNSGIFIRNLLLSLPWKNFWNQSISGKVIGKRMHVRWGMLCRKMKNSLEI